VSYVLGDLRAAIVIAAMVILAITTAFIQEHRSNEAAARLRAMVKTTASVRRSSGSGDGNDGFVPLLGLYWPLVAAMLLSYATLTHLVKAWFVRRWGM
jgi:hypothetical protein